jgi:flagella basal body P-ring formation protein FlgA
MRLLLCAFAAALIALLSLAGMTAHAEESSSQPVALIREAAAAYVAARVPAGASVEAAALDNRLRLVACAEPLRTGTLSSPSNGAWTVTVSCTAPQVWTLYVPVRVHDQKPVVILTHNIRMGQPITADALTVESRDTAALGFGYLSDPAQAVGKTLRRPLAAGTALTPEVLAAVPSIRRGQQVTLLGRAGAFEVRASGKAMGDGGAGERIAVENETSKRIVEGVVRDGGVVEVAL